MNDLSELPVSEASVERLQQLGFTTCASVALSEASVLSEKSSIIELDEARRLVAAAREHEASKGFSTTSDNVEPPARLPCLTTGRPELDAALDGGLSSGAVTGFYGENRTRLEFLAQHLAVYAQLPTEVGGLGGSSVYVDTTGSFNREFVSEVVRNLGTPHINALAEVHSVEGSLESEKNIAELVDSVVDCIHVFRGVDEERVYGALRVLDEVIESWGVSFVCVDRVVDVLDYDGLTASASTSAPVEVSKLLGRLTELSLDYGLTTVCTMGVSRTTPGWTVEPECGSAMRHSLHELVRVEPRDGDRVPMEVTHTRSVDTRGVEPSIDVPATSWSHSAEEPASGSSTVGCNPRS